MKNLIVPLLILLIVSCSTDSLEPLDQEISEKSLSDSNVQENSDNEDQEVDSENQNTAPALALQSYLINEHSAVETSIGFIQANDEDGDDIIFSIESEADIIIDEHTGEIKVGPNLKLDFETINSLEFTVSAFDGSTTSHGNFSLSVIDVDETTLLNEAEKDLITYFQHLVFWKGHANTPVERNQKWAVPLQLNLAGTISNSFSQVVNEVISEYNTIFNGNFTISIAETEELANAEVFYGTKEELESHWPDMYQIVKDGDYHGYAITPSSSYILSDSRIWISNEAAVLFKHELGHALGFGHSDKCEEENSFLCSQISVENNILSDEEKILRYAYHSKIEEGLTESDIEKILADIIINEQ